MMPPPPTPASVAAEREAVMARLSQYQALQQAQQRPRFAQPLQAQQQPEHLSQDQPGVVSPFQVQRPQEPPASQGAQTIASSQAPTDVGTQIVQVPDSAPSQGQQPQLELSAESQAAAAAAVIRTETGGDRAEPY